MPSAYLASGEYATYGAPAATTDAQVTQASVLIDAYLRRPEGLVYSDDSDGNPCFMKAMAAVGPFVIASGLAPGVNVPATVVGPVAFLNPGAVVIAEKATPLNLEALVVSSITGSQVVFERVTKTHAPNATYHTGLTIFETRQLPSSRPLVVMSKNPICRIISMSGRYGHKRRGAIPAESGLLSIVSQFGGASSWEAVNVDNVDTNQETGQVWIPSGLMMTDYTDVRLHYVAGFSSTSIPDAIKLATARIIDSQMKTPLNGNVKLMKAGDTQIERFIDSVIDSSVRQMISGYRARTYA